MGSSNRGVTNVKLTSRVNYHQASDKMKLAAFMTGLASAQYGAPMNYQAQPMAPMGGGAMNNMMLPLLLLGDNGLGGSGSSSDMLLPLMLMGGMGGGDASGMNSMLPLLLLGDGLGSGSGSSSDMLLPLMLMGGMGGAGGDMGGMGGLLPLLLLGDSEYVIPTASLAPKCANITDLTKVAECNTLVAAFDTAAAAGAGSVPDPEECPICSSPSCSCNSHRSTPPPDSQWPEVWVVWTPCSPSSCSENKLSVRNLTFFCAISVPMSLLASISTVSLSKSRNVTNFLWR